MVIVSSNIFAGNSIFRKNIPKKIVKFLDVHLDKHSSSSYNYSWTCPNHSIIFLCASLTTTFWTTKNSPNMGNWPTFEAIFWRWNINPNLEQFSSYLDTSSVWRRKKILILLIEWEHFILLRHHYLILRAWTKVLPDSSSWNSLVRITQQEF